ncbi:hypothetical protein ABGB17_32200 [Sphaerisporangium sp. B11E5]|uniref:hypothetical protein n=1 Tax=Sphaerisporangium sp. B11E5 TaxID=3153563 RepID=UPI00325DCF03
MSERVERARILYERAVFDGDPGALTEADRVLDAVEADLALARGRVAHGRFMAGGPEDPRERTLFERAAELYRVLGDVRGEGEALFWTAMYHQVVRRDDGAAVPLLERSLVLATEAGDELTMSYALRHLGIAAHSAGRLDTARAHLEESSRLRRGFGFLPGVAANLVGLAYIASAGDRPADAAALLDEAAGLATDAKAAGVMRSIDEARAHLGG